MKDNTPAVTTTAEHARNPKVAKHATIMSEGAYMGRVGAHNPGRADARAHRHSRDHQLCRSLDDVDSAEEVDGPRTEAVVNVKRGKEHACHWDRSCRVCSARGPSPAGRSRESNEDQRRHRAALHVRVATSNQYCANRGDSPAGNEEKSPLGLDRINGDIAAIVIHHANTKLGIEGANTRRCEVSQGTLGQTPGEASQSTPRSPLRTTTSCHELARQTWRRHRVLGTAHDSLERMHQSGYKATP